MTEPIHEIPVEGFIESFDRRYPTFILKTLLCDRTTGRNIIWADNEYEALGDGYMGDDEITVEKITGMNSGVIKPRIAKEQEKQSQRTKSRAEVFTPSWLCNQMNNDLDEVWFGRRNVFNTEAVADDGTKTWTVTEEPVVFPKLKRHGWHAYVEAPRLEITCGEAPFVCSRYDTVTGDKLPVGNRVGFLDRKLRIVTEKSKTRKKWVCCALNALRATYAFEYQGDNLLIARINVLETFAEHLRDRWGSDPKQDELERAAWIVSWNIWQMNGFTDAVPTNKMGAEVESTLETFEEPEPEPIQPSLPNLFDDVFPDITTEETEEWKPKETVPLCVIYDWQNDEPFEFATLKGKAAAMGKKFYAVIGNPPYQTESASNNQAKPIYHVFMDESYKVADCVELITPARFLSNQGATPSAWNKKMLKDEHLKIMGFFPKSNSVFPNTEIKGGVVITYHDEHKKYKCIDTFIPFAELSSIYAKVNQAEELQKSNLGDWIFSPDSYRFSEVMFLENPELVGRTDKQHAKAVASSVFGRYPEIFHLERPDDGDLYVGIYGRENNQRTQKYLKKKYLAQHANLEKWKVIIPGANGSGALGEVLSTPLVGRPLIGHTQTFISIGALNSGFEAESLYKYIQTKFLRALLGIMKTTQNNQSKATWSKIPLQDFTSASDIDWTQSVADIDRQLYAKYGLDDEEIQFIESHVKEMN